MAKLSITIVAKFAIAAIAKGCAAAIFAVSFVHRYSFSVDNLPWSMAGVFVAILAVAAVAMRFFVAAAAAAALLRHLRAITIATP